MSHNPEIGGAQKVIFFNSICSLIAEEWVFLWGGFLSISYLGVLVWRFNFMRKESDHKDNVIGFLNLFMVMELVSLTKLSSNLGASVTEIATKLLTIKSPVK